MRKFRLLSALALFFFIALSVTFVKAASYDLKTGYTNSVTDYSVYYADDAGILSSDEIAKLVQEAEAATEYGNLVIYTAAVNPFGSDYDRLGHDICAYLGYESTTVILVDMQNRKLVLRNSGANESRISVGKSNVILDNNYKYATNGDYYKFFSKSIDQVNKVLKGARIAQPMKYVSNAFFAVVTALLINIIMVKVSTSHNKPSDEELFENLSTGFVETNGLEEKFIRQTKTYSPRSSSGGGGGGGGGGGHSSGGSHGF